MLFTIQKLSQIIPVQIDVIKITVCTEDLSAPCSIKRSWERLAFYTKIFFSRSQCFFDFALTVSTSSYFENYFSKITINDNKFKLGSFTERLSCNMPVKSCGVAFTVILLMYHNSDA